MTNPTAPGGLIAILRGLPTADAQEAGTRLYESGFRAIEVPLNSPDPLKSIEILRATLPADCLVGAGTVLTVEQVQACAASGAQLIVSPTTNTAVIEATVAAGMASYPGAATPSEAFAALTAGAAAVKIFPAEQVGLAGFRGWTSVLPQGVGLIPVGGIDETNMEPWIAAGATGFGMASSLYKPGRNLIELSERASRIVAAWSTLQEAGTAP